MTGDSASNPSRLGTWVDDAAVWLKIGATSFGGPAAQIQQMHEEIVTRRGWIDEAGFRAALNFAMVLPGPEAQQLATYLGWRRGGVWGAVLSGGLFVAPGAVVLFGLAWLAAAKGEESWLAGAFSGMSAVVVALIAVAVFRIGARTIKTLWAGAMAVAAFIAIAAFNIGLPWILAVAAGVGALAFRSSGAAEITHTQAHVVRPAASWFVRLFGLTVLFASLWAGPLVMIVAAFGPTPFLKVSVFFLQAALVTFGGAYAVLPFVASGAVGEFHWISAADMAHGLALAETTPGPLILVNEYVGFFAGWNACKDGGCGSLNQLEAAALAAFLTVWTTFLPCFYMVLVGAPLVERTRISPRMQASLDSLTAAVVGVIATLGVSIARQTYLVDRGVDTVSVGVGLVALVMIVSRKVPTVVIVLCGAIFGTTRFWHGA